MSLILFGKNKYIYIVIRLLIDLKITLNIALRKLMVFLAQENPLASTLLLIFHS
jgi:hypothetical protein